MSFQAMPFLFLNMGGEMAYILEQRLQAQNVGEEKAHKVLGEIMETMFEHNFLKELFRPQPTYSRDALRQLFEQIAHSSVMRLNEQSMDKLFDLMLMAFKYQTALCKEPSELVLVTANHLEGIKQIFKDQPHVAEKIDNASSLLMDSFGEMPLWKMATIRSELMSFMLGARVKVSLMLREKRQLEDGRFVLFQPGEQIELPYNAVAPGTVRYRDQTSGNFARVETFPIDAQQFKTTPNQQRTMSRGTTLGQNMYKAEQVGRVNALPVTATEGSSTASASGEIPSKTAVTKESPSMASGNELALLSMLLQREKAPTAADFELSLFDDEPFAADDENHQDAKRGARASIGDKKTVIKKKSLGKAIEAMDLKDRKDEAEMSAQKGQKGRDLLAMMDEAGSEASKKAVGVKKTTQK